MKVLQGLIVAATIPLMFLNIFGVIIAGIWLGVVGDWKPVIEGVIALFTTTFLLSLLLMPAIGLALPGVWFANRNIVAGVLVFAGLANIYTIALAVVWCSFVLFHFMGEATSATYIPLLFWSYGVATGPWSYMASKEAIGDEGGDGSTLIVFFIEFAFLVVVVVSLFTNLDRLTVFEIFGAVMALALVTQLAIVLLTTYAERQNNDSRDDSLLALNAPDSLLYDEIISDYGLYLENNPLPPIGDAGKLPHLRDKIFEALEWKEGELCDQANIAKRYELADLAEIERYLNAVQSTKFMLVRFAHIDPVDQDRVDYFNDYGSMIDIPMDEVSEYMELSSKYSKRASHDFGIEWDVSTERSTDAPVRRIVKYCTACDEGFAEKFHFCPNCGGSLDAFEMTPVET